jgi:hypothetical protein
VPFSVQGMTGATSAPSSTGAPNAPDPAAPGRRYRQRGETARVHRLTPRFTDEELAMIQAAADAAQMTVTGFCALAALAMARREADQPHSAGDAAGPSLEELAEMQRELFAARNAVNRAGVNLNQAVAQLNSTGQPPVWLGHAVNRVTREVDAVVARIQHALG